jgi:hypothetical protein
MACRPKEFHGNDGTVGLLRWIEKIEVVLYISNCLDNFRVKYASCSFQGKALTWCNTQIQTRCTDVETAMTWAEFKTLLADEYCLKNEMQKLESEF